MSLHRSRTGFPALGGTILLAWVLGACSLPSSTPPQTFKVTIENVSDRSGINTVISTGVAITHSEDYALFEAGRADKGEGLEGVAEDGHKWPLNAALKFKPQIYDQVIFDTPVGSERPVNIAGGKRYEFFIAASQKFPYLSLATMVGFTNDLNLMLDTDGRSGFRLFHPDGRPKSDEELAEVAAHWDVWDVGTEINEPNGAGPNQPDAPSGLNVGPPDVGLVTRYEDVRRPLDAVHDALSLQILNAPGEPSGTLDVTLTNRTNQPGLVPSPLAPVLAIAHDPTWSAFDEGLPDLGKGLEPLAEDGNAAPLIASVESHPSYLTHVVAAGSGGGAIGPGESVTFRIAVDADHPMLTVLTMYVASNDIFLTFLNRFGESGIEALGRSDSELARMTNSKLAFMDAGTERNEEIGDGRYQGNSQDSQGEGEPDIGTVRRYRKPTDPLVPADIAVISITRADDVKRNVRHRPKRRQGRAY